MGPAMTKPTWTARLRGATRGGAGPIAIAAAVASAALGCTPTPPPHAPCVTVRSDSGLRDKEAEKTLDELVKSIQLSPEDEALRAPKSIADVRAILRRDTVYLFPAAAAYARSLGTPEGRLLEASLELLLGESQLLASQVLTAQSAWVGNDLRIARASLATESAGARTDRTRMFVELIRSVEEGNKIADALGIAAPAHLARGAEVIRGLRVDARTDRRTAAIVAEYHRLRGEWAEFDMAMAIAEGTDRSTPALCYLRAMEQLERRGRHDLGAGALRECLKKHPKFVRAQAALVLMASHPAAALRELAKLKAMNEDHYLVMLLEPTLAADQELDRLTTGSAPNAPR